MGTIFEAFKFILDGVELTHDPIGWEDFQANIARNIPRRSILVRFPSTLTFWGDGYDIIRSQYLESGFCGDIPFQVQKLCGGNVTKIFNGLVFISDSRPFDLDKCEVTVEVKDNNFAALIENNRELQTQLDAPKSKNGANIGVAGNFNLDIFDTDGTLVSSGGSKIVNGGKRKAHDWADAMLYILLFMTDNAVQFRSDWYDNYQGQGGTPGGEGICLVDGEEMRLGNDSLSPDMSFDNIFYPVAKQHNLWFTIETDSTGTFLRAEHESYFKNTEVILTLDKVKGVEQFFAQELLYAKIKLGSETTAKVGTLTARPPDGSTGTLPTVQFQSFIKEEYQIQGKCNIKSTLDLSVDIIVDNNIIEDSIMNDVDTYDDDNFLIAYDKVTEIARKSDPFNLTPALGSRIYNRDFMNDLVASRYNLQGNIAKYLGDGNDDCSEIRTSFVDVVQANPLVIPAVGINTITPYEFENELADPNNNYSNILFRYTIPQAGIYTFDVKLITQILISSADDSNFRTRIIVQRYDVADVLISETGNQSARRYGAELPFEQLFTGVVYGNATDYVIVKVEGVTTLRGLSSMTTRYNIGSTFECVTTTNGGGLFEPKDPDDYFTSIYKFEKYLSDEEMNELFAAPHKAVEFNRDGENNIKTWNNNTSVTLYTGKTDWEQISNLTPTV